MVAGRLNAFHVPRQGKLTTTIGGIGFHQHHGDVFSICFKRISHGISIFPLKYQSAVQCTLGSSQR